MGYVDPQQNIRSYVDVMNRKTQEIGDNFDLKFNELNQTMRANIARNAVRMQDEKLKKEIGLEAYLDLVNTTGQDIKGGWKDMNDNFLRNTLGNEYFDLVGKDDTKSIMKRKNIEKIPKILAQLQGTYMSLRNDFDKSIDITGGYAGGFNPETSARTIGFITDGNDMQYGLSEDGNLELSFKYDGEEFNNVSAQEMIEMSLEDGIGILTYGDAMGERQKIHDGIWTDKKFESAYIALKGKGADPNDSETWELYGEVNQQYKDAINNPNLYLGGAKSVLNKANLMRGYWPVIINDAYDEFKKGDGDQYGDLLKKLLPSSVAGVDGILGNEDDQMIDIPMPGEGNLLDKTSDKYSDWLNFYVNQGEAGVWDLANQDQKDLALTWFGSLDPQNTHIKEDRKRSVTKGDNTKVNLQNQKLRQSIANGNANKVETDNYRNEVRTWLKNSHDVSTGEFNDVAVLWGQPKNKSGAPMLVDEMNKWLNSPNGLPAVGFNTPKNGEFKIQPDGQVYVEYGSTDESGDPITQDTGIIIKPGELFATDLNIRKILAAAKKTYRDETQITEANSVDDPDGLF
jgi:hypothetical protein